MGLYDVPFCGFLLQFGSEDNFTKFPNMGYLGLVEADVVYVCKVCYCILT